MTTQTSTIDRSRPPRMGTSARSFSFDGVMYHEIFLSKEGIKNRKTDKKKIILPFFSLCFFPLTVCSLLGLGFRLWATVSRERGSYEHGNSMGISPFFSLWGSIHRNCGFSIPRRLAQMIFYGVHCYIFCNPKAVALACIPIVMLLLLYYIGVMGLRRIFY